MFIRPWSASKICGARRSNPPTGRRYFFLLSRHHAANTYGLHELLFFAFPQLPVAIVVFGITTFVLVLLLVRPIGRLRIAARALANGELATRVAKPDGEERIFGGDEIQGLVHDFNYMAEQLERLVGAQKILVRDVSHELRSPLARLSVALELAREEAPASMQEHLQRIDREAGRLNLLIGQLLRLSSMESTNASSHLDRFTLHGLVEELLPDAEYEAQQRCCTIQLLEHSDCMVQGNQELIYRAIENIVRNAIRYTRQDIGGRVEDSLRRTGWRTHGHARCGRFWTRHPGDGTGKYLPPLLSGRRLRDSRTPGALASAWRSRTAPCASITGKSGRATARKAASPSVFPCLARSEECVVDRAVSSLLQFRNRSRDARTMRKC